MKLLLYCTKAKNKYDRLVSDEHYGKPFYLYGAITENFESLNGKIVAECDFEVEEIFYGVKKNNEYNEIIDWGRVIQKSCLSLSEITEYLNYKNGYAIHIKNLHIFDKPYELGKALIYNFDTQYIVEKAPQNMMKVYNRAGECHILISIQPQWLCKILNGEKTIEVRKKVLKEMLG